MKCIILQEVCCGKILRRWVKRGRSGRMAFKSFHQIINTQENETSLRDVRLTSILKRTIADGDKLYKQSAGARDSATIPPPLHRSFDETCYINGKTTTLNKHKSLMKTKLLIFNNEEQLLRD